MTEWGAGDWVIDANMKDEPEYVWLTNANKAPLFKIEPITGTTEEITDGLNLIAAAPDMAEALEALCDVDTCTVNNEIRIPCENHGDAIKRMRVARAALAKAKQS